MPGGVASVISGAFTVVLQRVGGGEGRLSGYLFLFLDCYGNMAMMFGGCINTQKALPKTASGNVLSEREASMMRTISQLTEEIIDLKERNGRLKEDVSSLKNRVATLTVAPQQSYENFKALYSQVEELTARLKKADATAAEMAIERKDARSEIQELKEQNSALGTNHRLMEEATVAELTTLRNLVSELQQQQQEQQESSAQSAQEYRDAIQEWEIKERRYKVMQDELQTEIGQLKEALVAHAAREQQKRSGSFWSYKSEATSPKSGEVLLPRPNAKARPDPAKPMSQLDLEVVRTAQSVVEDTHICNQQLKRDMALLADEIDRLQKHNAVLRQRLNAVESQNGTSDMGHSRTDKMDLAPASPTSSEDTDPGPAIHRAHDGDADS